MKDIIINSEFITLNQLLKLLFLVNSGGEGKLFIKENKILINNILVKERNKKIYKLDIIQIKNNKYKII